MQVRDLKDQLQERTSHSMHASSNNGELPGGGGETSELRYLNKLANDINTNVEERINLQKDIFELEDMNVKNRLALQVLNAKAQVRALCFVCNPM